MHHTFVHTRLNELMKTFNYDSHPMGMFIRYGRGIDCGTHAKRHGRHVDLLRQRKPSPQGSTPLAAL